MDFLRDCEPTYEELKLFYMLQWSMNNHNCEPTYEELKPLKWYLQQFLQTIASLPMRNWN